MSDRAKIVLKSGKDQSIMRFHPWIFSGAIKKSYGNLLEGNVVDVYDNKDNFLGCGHYQIGSIAVRVLSFTPRTINEDFYRERLATAHDVRQILLANMPETDVYRLVHGEGDNLPGLIIDIYGDTAVVQMHSVGMFTDKEHISNALQNVYGESLKHIYCKSNATLPKKALENETKDMFLLGDKEHGVVQEYGIKYHINWLEGQKTGFFVDQRENRRLVGLYAKNRTVANVFGYTGGFSLFAMKHGAKKVHTIDSSAKAIDLTAENVELNFGKEHNHQGIAADAFDFFANATDTYDLIILDPPAFAKHHNVLSNALQGYKRINQRAFENIGKNGILLTFSCSQAVSPMNFRKSVFAAAANAKRKVRILHQLTQPADHPVNIFHPEGEYLKGLVLHVE
ncbi:MAG: class I SAM-dependent rRNA methyltransferase [Salinivirgaceae bacterium]|jgi:23S rRNA (cytosine1962-C5)-methyltransferase|nr:class I SAM-dependent rRNA methyltransferase [Salinivirgaceae bacterium]